MSKKEIKLSSEKLKEEKRLKTFFRIGLLVLLLSLLLAYFVIGIIYNNGNFSITLDKNLYYDKGLIIYDNPDYKIYRTELRAASPDAFDNISYRWLPDNIDNQGGGSHNGRNYLAYTFFIENTGKDVSDYWTEVVVEDVIKNVDEAVRIRLYKDGEYVTYAKLSGNGTVEPGTVPFKSDELVVREHISNFKPGDKSRYTLVLWIEGSDPECTDNILGGEFKVYMDFKSEVTEEEEKKK